MSNQAEADRTGMVLQKLTAQQIEERADKLAREVRRSEELAEKKRSHNREWNEQLRQHAEEIGRLALEVESGEAWVSAQLQFTESAEAPTKSRRRKATS